MLAPLTGLACWEMHCERVRGAERQVCNALAGQLDTLTAAAASPRHFLLAALHGLRAGVRVAGGLAGVRAAWQRPSACFAALLYSLQCCRILHSDMIIQIRSCCNLLAYSGISTAATA